MNMHVDSPVAVAFAQTKPLVPGYLVTPFGWAAQPLAELIQADPELLTHVFELDRVRMHVVALALAHLDESPASGLATVLFRGSIHEVLHRVVGRSPPGIRRVLRRLPFAVLSREGYQRLIELLDDPRSAKLLHHLDAKAITNSTVRVLHEIPAVLRSVFGELVRCIERIEKLDQLPDRSAVARFAWCRCEFRRPGCRLGGPGPAGAICRSAEQAGCGIAAAANLATKTDWLGASDRCNSRHLRAGQAVQELSRKFCDTDRCRGMRGLFVGRSGCTRRMSGDAARPSGLDPQRGAGPGKCEV